MDDSAEFSTILEAIRARKKANSSSSAKAPALLEQPPENSVGTIRRRGTFSVNQSTGRLFRNEEKRETLVVKKEHAVEAPLKPFNELVQEKPPQMRVRPAVPEKPKKKQVKDIPNFNQPILKNVVIAPSVEEKPAELISSNTFFAQSSESFRKPLTTEKQKPSAVNNLRLQFEQKLAEQKSVLTTPRPVRKNSVLTRIVGSKTEDLGLPDLRTNNEEKIKGLQPAATEHSDGSTRRWGLDHTTLEQNPMMQVADVSTSQQWGRSPHITETKQLASEADQTPAKVESRETEHFMVTNFSGSGLLQTTLVEQRESEIYENLQKWDSNSGIMNSQELKLKQQVLEGSLRAKSNAMVGTIPGNAANDVLSSRIVSQESCEIYENLRQPSGANKEEAIQPFFNIGHPTSPFIETNILDAPIQFKSDIRGESLTSGDFKGALKTNLVPQNSSETYENLQRWEFFPNETETQPLLDATKLKSNQRAWETPLQFGGTLPRPRRTAEKSNSSVNTSKINAGLEDKQQWKFVANEVQTMFNARRLDKNSSKLTQSQFDLSSIGRRTPFKYNLEINSANNAEASNFKTIYNATLDESNVDEFDDVDEDELADKFEDLYETIDGPIYANFSRLNLEAPRQRASYAERSSLRVRPQLKPTISFNHRDSVKNSVEQKRLKLKKDLEYITEEIISTEREYVLNLFRGVKNYTSMFARSDVPRNLQGRKDEIFANVEEIAFFHRDTMLPMLLANQFDLKELFEEFSEFIENGYMYSYVYYAMHQRASQKILKDFGPYFEHLRLQLGERLGIGSFLLQPIQRVPRYGMLFDNLLKTLLELGTDCKAQLASCCHLRNRIDRLLRTINEADLICDITGWSDLYVMTRDNKFRRCVDLYVNDLDRKRHYHSKIFIFDKSLIYTEVRRKELLFRGFYDATRRIDLISTQNTFTIGYRREQLCEFRADPATIESCVKSIEEMIDFNADRMRRQDVNRLSTRSDSGLGNIWSLPEEN